MRSLVQIIGGIILFFSTFNSYAQLKSVVYDFDGLDNGQTSLPEGDYSYGDLTYKTVPNPLGYSEVLGDRVLQANIQWNNNFGAFGRGISRFIEFDPNNDILNFFFYNPASNSQSAMLDVILGDDDNSSYSYESTADDTWKKSLVIPGSTGWQLISIPLKDFTDSNAGGNGVFDIAFTGNKGMLIQVEFRFNNPGVGTNAPVFFIDMICFSEGALPKGATVFDLPPKAPSDYCVLGAYQNENPGDNHLIPSKFEGLFPSSPNKKIKYVNYFQAWATDGSTTPSSMPGTSPVTLINNGYTPIITWEPMFTGYSRLDPVQPRLSNIINGDYNTYIDAFADQVKLLPDTVIIRLMHEFEGDWYPWSISQNGGNPSLYVTAYRKIVDRFRNRGVTNVQWMWCVNSDYAPYRAYNWVIGAYPGDNYIDIVATDIYNNHEPISLPWWKSFKNQLAESYYYLTKYIPNKPLYICEVGCRERYSSENPASESKGDWYARMDKEMQSNFHKARALIFFNAAPDQNWLVNSSASALQSLTNNVWNDDYYFKSPLSFIAEKNEYGSGLYVYPNPANGLVTINYSSNTVKEDFSIDIYNQAGMKIYSEVLKSGSLSFSKQIDFNTFPRGIYYVQLEASLYEVSEKKLVRKAAKLVLQ